ncbi:ABC transporter ATP-binding protein [Lichenibacterium ramalinae]|uniref:ABC transporter ATP-binding protein n=1 Tax=Lichenibacterium ramalinae TaxID=2316527 RepID=A0A4Q2R9L4_9HYPH|nr:ABC transporter ATP-binding protein [Lichenibacterium ramalinae]RYB01538.1 ABC transporter ATP-binding protein [Lichenibacterium ramalinae]
MSAPASLVVTDLRTRFGSDRVGATVVDGVTFTLLPGRTTALVGESGCGKSATALSLMRLIDKPGRIIGGSVTLNGRDLLGLSESEMEQVRGAAIGMIFQDPLTSLNPALTIGQQIVETLQAHRPMSRADADRTAIDLLTRVGVTDAARRIGDYPHHFSGGMRQRVLIAAAISCSPSVIIADEPTTALDVTVQAKILRLLHDLQGAMGASLLLITHDLGVVASMADEVLVMYAGRIVERADVDTLFHDPRHPYTKALLACVAGIEDDRSVPLEPIGGSAPDLWNPPVGCRFAPRCPVVQDVCRSQDQPLRRISAEHEAACILVEEDRMHG